MLFLGAGLDWLSGELRFEKFARIGAMISRGLRHGGMEAEVLQAGDFWLKWVLVGVSDGVEMDLLNIYQGGGHCGVLV